jgi:hypothetical protein
MRLDAPGNASPASPKNIPIRFGGFFMSRPHPHPRVFFVHKERSAAASRSGPVFVHNSELCPARYHSLVASLTRVQSSIAGLNQYPVEPDLCFLEEPVDDPSLPVIPCLEAGPPCGLSLPGPVKTRPVVDPGPPCGLSLLGPVKVRPVADPGPPCGLSLPGPVKARPGVDGFWLDPCPAPPLALPVPEVL